MADEKPTRKETIARLAEESTSQTKKAIDTLTSAKERIAATLKRIREDVGMPPKRRASHPELKAVGP